MLSILFLIIPPNLMREDNESMKFTLWQNGRRLAYYISELHSIFKSNVQNQWRNTIDVIMKPSSCFPGIIGPKLELTAYVDIFNMHTGEQLFIDRMDCDEQLNALNNGSRHYMCLHNGMDVKGQFIRQKAVCHAGLTSKSINFERYF